MKRKEINITLDKMDLKNDVILTQEKICPKNFVPEKIIHCKVIKLIIIFSSQLRYLFRSCLYTQIFKSNINLWSSTFQAFFPEDIYQ